jgi:predicted dehydrogenase
MPDRPACIALYGAVRHALHARVIARCELGGVAVASATAQVVAQAMVSTTTAFPPPGEVLAAESRHVVQIATPTGTHASLVERALQAGSHISCRKPFASGALSICNIV